MQRFLPFLILGAGAVGLYFLWSKVFAAPQKNPDQVGADQVTKFRNDCAAKGGVFESVASGIGAAGPVSTDGLSCRLPDLPASAVSPSAFGSCPDRLSCQGMPSHPDNIPTPPASAPTGSSSLLFGPTTYRTFR